MFVSGHILLPVVLLAVTSMFVDSELRFCPSSVIFLLGGVNEYWAFALGAISTSVIFTWVLNNTGSSLVMASIIHLMMNFGMSVVGILGLIPSPRDGWMIASILFAIYAVIVVVIAGPSRLSRRLDNNKAFA